MLPVLLRRSRVLLLCTTAIAVPTAAQTPARDTLSAVVVTATRVPVAPLATTAATTVIDGETLRAQGITRVADALRAVPGVQMVASGPQGSVTSLFLRGGNSNYVRVLVDGVAVNDAGGAFDFSSLSTDNVARIEVVRGPASVLYGADAVTGVIQIITRDGQGPARWLLEAGRGSQGALRGSLGVRGGDATAGFSLLAARQATDGILPFNNRNVTDVLSASGHLRRGATDARLSARWSSALYQYPTEYDGTVADRNAEQVDHRLVVSADLGHRFSPDVAARALLTSSEFLPRSNDGPDTPADTLGFYGYYSRSVRTRRAADARLDMQLAPRTTLTTGVEVSRDRERSSSLSMSQYGNSPGAFEATRHTTALYAQAIGDVDGRFSYSAGVRLDDNSAFGTFRTARLGAAWVLDGETRLRVATGTAFKAPSFFENFATGFVRGNPTLRPERARTTEVGIERRFLDGSFALLATAYVQQFSDVIQYTGTAPSAGAPNYYNIAAAKADGAELAAEWRLGADAIARFVQSWTDTRTTAAGFDASAGANYVKGERLIRRPAQSSSLTLSQGWTDGSRMSVTVLRVGERPDRDFAAYPAVAVTLPAYTRVDAAIVLPFRETDPDGPQLLVNASNLLDARYEEILHFAAPGRQWFVGIRIGR